MSTTEPISVEQAKQFQVQPDRLKSNGKDTIDYIYEDDLLLWLKLLVKCLGSDDSRNKFVSAAKRWTEAIDAIAQSDLSINLLDFGSAASDEIDSQLDKYFQDTLKFVVGLVWPDSPPDLLPSKLNPRMSDAERIQREAKRALD